MIVPLGLVWGSVPCLFWEVKRKAGNPEGFPARWCCRWTAGIPVSGGLSVRQCGDFPVDQSRTSSIPFSYSCRILNRFRKPIRICMIQGDHQLLDLIFFGRSFYVFWQIIQPDFSQAHNTLVDPSDRLSITVQAIAAKHLFHFDIQAFKMIQPLLNYILQFIRHLNTSSKDNLLPALSYFMYRERYRWIL